MSKTSLFLHTIIIELEHDKSSTFFQNSFISYKEFIDPDATINDMLTYVAATISEKGTDKMIEGVGYVKFNNKCKDESSFSGITLIHNPDISTEKL